jgi:hypothetical protein
MSGDVRAALKATELGSAAKRREGPSGDIPRCRKTGSADKPLRGQLRISLAEDRSRAVCPLEFRTTG